MLPMRDYPGFIKNGQMVNTWTFESQRSILSELTAREMTMLSNENRNFCTRCGRALGDTKQNESATPSICKLCVGWINVDESINTMTDRSGQPIPPNPPDGQFKHPTLERLIANGTITREEAYIQEHLTKQVQSDTLPSNPEVPGQSLTEEGGDQL